LGLLALRGLWVLLVSMGHLVRLGLRVRRGIRVFRGLMVRLAVLVLSGRRVKWDPPVPPEKTV
jgi:hypothetical protein